MPNASEDERRRLFRLAGTGMEFTSAILVGVLGGWGLDKLLGTAPWMLLSGVGVGFTAGLFVLVRVAKSQPPPKPKPKPPQP